MIVWPPYLHLRRRGEVIRRPCCPFLFECLLNEVAGDAGDGILHYGATRTACRLRPHLAVVVVVRGVNGLNEWSW